MKLWESGFNFKSVLLLGPNPSTCASQSEIGLHEKVGHPRYWAGQEDQDWLRSPQLVEVGRDTPIGVDLPETPGKMTGEGKKRK